MSPINKTTGKQATDSNAYVCGQCDISFSSADEFEEHFEFVHQGRG